MITEVWDVNNEMINQIRLNTVMCHLWTSQNSALMPEACEFLMTFNSKSRIYDIGNKF